MPHETRRNIWERFVKNTSELQKNSAPPGRDDKLEFIELALPAPKASPLGKLAKISDF